MTQAFIQVGPLQIAILDPGGSGAIISTFYLPAPSDIKLSFGERGINSTLINGSESNRRLGYLPKLDLTWSLYDETNPRWGYTIGSSNGNQLTFTALMGVLDTAPGFIKIAPGLSTGGFVCNKWDVGQFTVEPNTNIIKDLQITFYGGIIQPTKVLGAF